MKTEEKNCLTELSANVRIVIDPSMQTTLIYPYPLLSLFFFFRRYEYLLNKKKRECIRMNRVRMIVLNGRLLFSVVSSVPIRRQLCQKKGSEKITRLPKCRERSQSNERAIIRIEFLVA